MSSVGHQQSAISNASYHVAGVAGVGMSALAQVLLARGFRVTGSDRYLDRGQDLPVLDKLRRAGVRLVPQDGSGVRADTAGVVVSTAIEPDNPDVAAAARRGVPVIHRAALLASLARPMRTVAVTGTAGKTTVTGMIGWVLEQAGLDPMVIAGGAVINWLDDRTVGNVRIGRGDLWVLEADESDRSLLQFAPDWAVITNVSKDHFELAEVERLFRQFAGQVKRGVVGCYGADPWPPAGFQPGLSAAGVSFDYRGVPFQAPLLGRHNAENALQCVLLCERLGRPLPEVSRALKTFRGIQRRLEWIGQVGGVAVIDDYAHNPAKITAAWKAVAPYFRRLIAVWRPHGYAPLALMLDDLVRALAAVAGPRDQVLILPVYYAGGTAAATVDAPVLVERLNRAGVAAAAAPDYEDLNRRLLTLARPGDAILFMGARDPFLPVFARRLPLNFEHFFADRVSGSGRVAHEDHAADEAPPHGDEVHHQ